MKMSEYIAVCQTLLSQHGDHEVVARDPYGPLGSFHRDPGLPVLRHIKQRESRERREKAVSSNHLEATDEKVFVL